MELIVSLFEVITPWHWLGLALILLAFEMMLGTYDLLWISAAAFLTAAWAALPLPPALTGWMAELIIFCVFGLILLVLGRTVFSGFRNAKSDRPGLNQRGQSLVGKPALAVMDFAGGQGRVKVGDSTWLASSEAGVSITNGMDVRITSVSGTVLHVEPA